MIFVLSKVKFYLDEYISFFLDFLVLQLSCFTTRSVRKLEEIFSRSGDDILDPNSRDFLWEKTSMKDFFLCTESLADTV